MRINEEEIEIIESRSEGEPSKLVGYGAVFYDGTEKTEYKMKVPGLGTVRERVLPTAFDNVKECDLRFEHDSKQILDTTENTLKISKDQKGIRVESDIDKTDPQYQTAVAKIRKKIVKGMSFGFNELRTKDRWEKTADGYIRWLVDCAAFEFSLVRSPAYSGTSNGLRSADESTDIAKSFEKFRAEQNKNKLEQLNTSNPK